MKPTKKNLTVILLSLLIVILSTGGCAQPKKEVTVKIKTSAVCGMCKDKIEQGLAFEKGIKDVSLDVETKIATITFNPKKTDPDKIREKITKLGYDADDMVADKVAYDKLPVCCKKDAKKHK